MRHWLHGAVVVAALVPIVFLVGGSRASRSEPDAGGHDVSAWLRTPITTRSAWSRGLPLAIREMGAEAVPQLVKGLEQRSSFLFDTRARLARWIPPFLDRYVPEPGVNPDAIRQRAAWALGELGSTASAAIPAIILGTRDRNANTRRICIRALTRISSDPDVVVPALSRMMMDREASIRLQVAPILGNYGAAATSSVPDFAMALNDPDAPNRVFAALQLLRIAPGNPEALETLRLVVSDYGHEVGEYVAGNLDLIAGADRSAIPLLSLLMTSTNAAVRQKVAEFQRRSEAKQPSRRAETSS